MPFDNSRPSVFLYFDAMKGKRKTRSRAMAFTPEMMYEVMKMPTNEQKGELGFAIMEYAFHGTECGSGDGLVRSAFERLRADIDQSITEESLREAGYTVWGDIRATVRSWIFRIRFTLIRKFGKKEE